MPLTEQIISRRNSCIKSDCTAVCALRPLGIDASVFQSDPFQVWCCFPDLEINTVKPH